MELEQLLDELYENKMSAFAGMVTIKDIPVQLQSEVKMDQTQKMLIVNNLVVNKTNVAMTCVYIVDIVNDNKNTVISDLEQLVAFMFFGVDKVAKKVVPASTQKI